MSKKIIRGDVNLRYLYLEELPEFLSEISEVTEHFDCSVNNLTSLKGAPQSIGGGFHCGNNKLTSLEGAPKSVKGDFFCGRNAVQFTEEQIRAVSNIGGGVYV